MNIRIIALVYLFFVTKTIIAQNWGSDSILHPSFANDMRFNQDIDLSGSLNGTPQDLPNWTRDLILYQMPLHKFGVLPTINSAKEHLWVLEKLGIKGVVLTPVALAYKSFSWENPEYWNFYTHTEPKTLDPALGTEADFVSFVAQLHGMGIKVFLDFEFHGVFDRDFFRTKIDWLDAYNDVGSHNRSSLLSEHPDFFKWESDTFVAADGLWYQRPIYSNWNSAELKWSDGDGVNLALMDWYKNTLVYDWLEKYDLDGFRLDLEPFEVASEVGYGYWEEVKNLAKLVTGKDIILIPEDGNAERNNAFAFAQEDFGVSNPRFGFGGKVKDFMVSESLTNYPENNSFINLNVSPVNIVDVVKSNVPFCQRDETFYSSAISSHDNWGYTSQGRLVYWGYGMLFQPFIPFWFMGNEFNASNQASEYDENHQRIYFNRVNWHEYTQHIEHYNAVRKMVYIRTQYRNIIGPSTHRLKDKPMIRIMAINEQPDLPSYAYYNTNNNIPVGIVVVGTKETAVNSLKLSIPLIEMGLGSHQVYEVHNLMTDEVFLSTSNDSNNAFVFGSLPSWGTAIYKIEPYFNLKPNCIIETPLDLQDFRQGVAVDFKVNTFDADGDIVRVDFFINGQLYSSINQAPYEINIPTSNGVTPGSYILSAIAYDNLGDSTESNYRLVKIIENQPPLCQIVSPQQNQIFNQNDVVNFTVSASDFDGAIDSVLIIANGICIHQLLTPPYTYNYNSTFSTPAGFYHCYARAIDNDGIATNSDSVLVSIIPSTNIRQDINKQAFLVYPNPIVNSFVIQGDNIAGKELLIQDNLGQIVYKSKLNSNTEIVNIAQVQKGIIILKIEEKTSKLIKL